MPEVEAARRAGRPRKEEAGPAILAATRGLVAAHGYAGVTTEMIAKAAGVGKQTIYRRWTGKADLVLDAFLAYARQAVDRPRAPAAPGRSGVAAFLRRTFDALEETGPAVRSLMAAAQDDPDFRRVFRERFIEPRRAALRAVLAGAVGPGGPGDADLDAAVVSLFGAVWYRLLLDEPVDAAFAERLASIVVSGLGARG